MNRFLILLLVFCLFLGCEPNIKPKKPDSLIDKDKMTNVLYDMFITSSAKGTSRTKFEIKGIDPETYILKKYNIDSLQFAMSNDYYAHDIDVYKEMIESIKSRLTSEKEKYQAIDKKESELKKKEKDSLKRLRQQQLPNPNLVKPLAKKKQKK